MPQYKCTAFYRVEDAGWSESYYIVQDDYLSARTSFIALLVARMKQSPEEVKCIAKRISVWLNPRDGASEVTPPGATYEEGTWSGGTPNAINLASNAILLKMGSNYTRWNRIFFRGIPDEIMVSNRRGTAFAAWDAIFTGAGGMRVTMLTQGFQIKTKDPVSGLSRFDVPTDFIWGDFTNRRVGRPFGLRPGRRSRAA